MAKTSAFDALYQYLKNKPPQMGFFSTLDELIGAAPMEKAPAEQWANYLKPGRTFEREGVKFPLKGEEIEYTKLADLLNDPKKVFTRDDLRQAVQMKRPMFGLTIGTTNAKNYLRERQAEQGIRIQPPQYRSYSTPTEGRYEESITTSPDFYDFNGGHFDPDTLAWSRSTEQPLADKSGLMHLIEEIQSDRHSAAAEKGVFYTPEQQAERDRIWRQLPLGATIPSRYNELEKEATRRRGYRTPDEEAELERLRQVPRFDNPIGLEYLRRKDLTKTPPDTPFKNPVDYAALEMKKQLLNAANSGANALGIVPGSDVVNRFIPEGMTDPRVESGMKYAYDELYPSVLKKLAKQYGLEVSPQAYGSKSNVNIKPDVFMDLDIETPQEFNSALDDLLDEEDYSTIPAVLKSTLSHMEGTATKLGLSRKAIQDLNHHVWDMQESSQRAVKGSPTDLKEQVARFQKRFVPIYEQFQNDANAKIAKSVSKTVPAISLTPEDREKIKRIGVPLWATAGALGLGSLSQGEDNSGYAGGGRVKEGFSSADLLAKLMDKLGGPNEDPQTALNRRRFASAFGSQIYGLDPEGDPAILGWDHVPGIVDEVLQLPELIYPAAQAAIKAQPAAQVGKTLGLTNPLNEKVASLFNETPQFSKDALKRTTELASALNRRMHVTEPKDFKDRAIEAAGTMVGQIPVPEAAASRLRSMAGKLGLSPLEWFSPTVAPSIKNYGSGAAFGATFNEAIDRLTKYLQAKDEENKPEQPPDAHAYATGYAKGGKVADLMRIAKKISAAKSVEPKGASPQDFDDLVEFLFHRGPELSRTGLNELKQQLDTLHKKLGLGPDDKDEYTDEIRVLRGEISDDGYDEVKALRDRLGTDDPKEISQRIRDEVASYSGPETGPFKSWGKTDTGFLKVPFAAEPEANETVQAIAHAAKGEGTPTEVNMDDLIATQPGVEEKRVRSMMETPPEEPATIVYHDGKHYIADGHHRLAAERAAGKPTTDVNLIGNRPADEMPPEEMRQAALDYDPPATETIRGQMHDMMQDPDAGREFIDSLFDDGHLSEDEYDQLLGEFETLLASGSRSKH